MTALLIKMRPIENPKSPFEDPLFKTSQNKECPGTKAPGHRSN
jgi:hypothetical protein